MKPLVILVFFLLGFFKMNGQSKINRELFQFITEEKDTIFIYTSEVRIKDSACVQITDIQKIGKIKEASVDQVFFYNNEKKMKVYFQFVLSSSIPKSDLYIYTSGLDKRKIHFSKDSSMNCSETLFQKIKKSLELKENDK